MASREIQIRQRGRGRRQEDETADNMQAVSPFWNRILDMRSDSIVMTTEDLEVLYQDAVDWFESMRPRDGMGNTVVSQMPKLLRMVINASNMCQAASTPREEKAAQQMLNDALDMMSAFVAGLQTTNEEEARIISRAIQNRRPLNTQEQGKLAKMKQVLWTNRSTVGKVAVVAGAAALTCAAVLGILWGLGVVGGAAAGGTAGTAAAGGTAGTTAAGGTAGAAAATGTAGAAAATGTAGAAAAATGTAGAAAATGTAGAAAATGTAGAAAATGTAGAAAATGTAGAAAAATGTAGAAAATGTAGAAAATGTAGAAAATGTAGAAAATGTAGAAAVTVTGAAEAAGAATATGAVIDITAITAVAETGGTRAAVGVAAIVIKAITRK
ncbi:WAG22 antigen-like [Branchiostoma floridae]|uniref:WAG22 antigen-like n=1 Tax=Branchiostoma floridae TaxID=7739 RepID=A0A9J7K7L7_BRAFL|nr:WAG22 antigen-like [Branchiostoma floridae]